MHGRRSGTLRDLRRENRSAVLWSLYFDRPRSRQDLGAATGLSPASVTNVVRELLDEGIVTEVGSQDSDGGRPRRLLDVYAEHGFVIGVDVGETRVQAGLYDLTLVERAKAERPFGPGEHDVAAAVQAIADTLHAVLADAAVDPAAVLGVGIGVPAIVEQGPEAVVHGQTFGWNAVPLERLLRAHTDLPLRFENCAKTTGQAELWFGAGRGARTAAVALIGSGVGASLVSGGSIYRGVNSSAGEWGHTTIIADGRRCRCGSSGCLEAYVGAEAILERFADPAAAMSVADSASASASAGDAESALAALVAMDESPAAQALLAQTAEYLGIGIANLVNLFNPERVILAGWAGLMLGGRLLPAIRSAAERHSLKHPFAATSIELGRLGPESMVLGAATLPLEGFLNGAIGHRP
ncbi:ROK family transcriptional regulator [Catenulispora rubra]|uniref:ROK family transcriptional regulator n=1 Tax=Catenulispora rubra TaxID=280293 RepID=UPI0018921037|nr:ROK family transcriptional regulator [Catenulispora rubra]